MTVLRDEVRTFGERRFRLTLVATSEMPPGENISAAHCLGFDHHGRVLLARHVERDWTIPGGHVEPGESPEEAVHRETIEEAAAVIRQPELVAVERIELLDGDPDPRYPVPAFQVFFVATVVQLDTLVPNAECTESRLFSQQEARGLPGWMDHNAPLFDVASAVFRDRQARVASRFAGVREALLGRGWCRLPGFVSGDLCDALRDRGGHEWRPMAEQVGSVRQEGWYCQPGFDELPPAVASFAGDLAATLGTVFDGVDFPPGFNEVTWQRQTATHGLVGPHRDQSFYTGVIAIATLAGSAPFTVLESRAPRVESDAWDTEPGDLVLLRGGGLGHPDARCPWHEIGRSYGSERITLTMRHTVREPGGWE